jgi:hypothetical protein
LVPDRGDQTDVLEKEQLAATGQAAGTEMALEASLTQTGLTNSSLGRKTLVSGSAEWEEKRREGDIVSALGQAQSSRADARRAGYEKLRDLGCGEVEIQKLLAAAPARRP